MMSADDSEKRLRQQDLNSQVQNVQRQRGAYDALMKRAKAVRLQDVAVAKIMDAYPTKPEGLLALLEEVERREKLGMK